MTNPISERNLTEYLINFSNLPFERVQERFRLRKLLEILNRIPSEKFESVLEIGPGLNSCVQYLQDFGRAMVLEPIEAIRIELAVSYSNFSAVNLSAATLEEYAHGSIALEHSLVVLSSVLHEIPEVDLAMQNLNSVIVRNGYVVVVVPNNRSLHRLLGVELGYLAEASELTATEVSMQQFRNFSCETLSHLFEKHNFEIVFIETSFIKPLTHQQMQEHLASGAMNDSTLEWLYTISNTLPNLGSEIFMIAKKQ